MQEPQRNVLSTFLSSRASFVELFLTALLLAFGINLVSSSLPLYLGLSDGTSLLAGTVLCILVVVYFVIRFARESHRTQIIEGVLSYNSQTNRIVTVREYHFARTIKSYVDSAIDTIPNVRKQWNEQTLNNAYIDDGRYSINTIHGAIEYFVFKELSLNLKEYFKDSNESATQPFYRNDIRSISENNLFLKLFTAPRLDTTYVDDAEDDDFPKVTRINNQHNDFVLILPKGSRVYRSGNHKAVIDTGKFEIVVETLFLSVNSEIPTGFHRYYLDLTRSDNVTDFNVGVKIDVVFKWWLFLLPSGLQYYRWIDSFLIKLEQNTSSQRFFDTLQWESVYPLIAHINSVMKNVSHVEGSVDTTSKHNPQDAADQ